PENPVESGPASLQLPASQEPVPMRTQTLKLGEPPAAAQPTDTAAEKTEAPAPAAETVVAAATPEATKPGATAPAPAPVGAASPPTSTSPAPKPEAADTKRKAAATTPAPAPAATAVKGDWTVQLGVFADESNARRLADRASTFGYKASVVSYKANAKTMYRVRVGAYGSKGQAD